MRENILKFDIYQFAHSKALATLIRNLNEAGVPYQLDMNELEVTVTIGDGY